MKLLQLLHLIDKNGMYNATSGLVEGLMQLNTLTYI